MPRDARQANGGCLSDVVLTGSRPKRMDLMFAGVNPIDAKMRSTRKHSFIQITGYIYNGTLYVDEKLELDDSSSSSSSVMSAMTARHR